MDAQGTVSDHISILSYNTSGWNTCTVNFIQSILVTHSVHILVVQEHWLLEKNLYRLENCFTGHEVFALPAAKSNSQINRGRPSGGMAFIVKSDLCSSVKHIQCPNSYRVQGLEVKIAGKVYVYINCYFPVDTQNANMDTTELLRTLQDIKFIMDRYDDDSNFILTGDLNADFSRNSVFVNLVKSFLDQNNLQTIWNKFNCDYTYSFSRVNNGVERTYFSVIDHFCVSSDLLNNCTDALPLYSPVSLSNHVPIILTFKCDLTHFQNISHEKVIKPPKPMWKRATNENLLNYQSDLRQYLADIDVPEGCLQCSHVNCRSSTHREQIDVYAYDIMEAISLAVGNNIPFSNSRPDIRPTIPGWTQYVKPFRDDAIFWHSVWMSAGKPQNCNLHLVMRRTRNKYHYAIRKVRKQEALIRKNKFLDDCLSGNVNNIFEKIKSDRKNKASSAKTVDGISGQENIADLFKNIYSDVYNKHKEDNVELSDFLNSLNDKINATDMDFVNKISDSLIAEIISKLHSGKNDVVFDWGSDALIHGVQDLSMHFKLLFKSCLVHGHISQLFAFCTLVPLIKDAKGSKCSSDNYRLIAISSLVLKIFDHIILYFFDDSLLSPNLQFGFQRGCSTTMCSWTMLESINYFTNRGSPMYVCLLDLTKAFDHLKYDILFKKLSTKIPPIFLRLVIVTYLSQSCCVRWDSTKSTYFNVTNGVRQGAVASPKYFNVYIDDLFNILKESGFGCYIDGFFYGLLGYADDCALLSPSRDGLQRMLNICEKYFSDHGIKISVNIIVKKSKTKCLAFNVAIEPKAISLYDRPLPWVNTAKHLGHTISKNELTDDDILQTRGEFISGIHALRQELGDQNPHVFMALVQTYLCSMYGSNLWDLYNESSEKLFKSWNFAVRECFKLPYATHRYIVYNISVVPHLRCSLIKRFIKFYIKLEKCNKPEVIHLFNIQKRDYRSVFGRNCFKICQEFNATEVNDIDLHDISMPIKISVQDEWRIPFLADLINLRDDLPGATDINMGDITAMIDFICTQ